MIKTIKFVLGPNLEVQININVAKPINIFHVVGVYLIHKLLCRVSKWIRVCSSII